MRTFPGEPLRQPGAETSPQQPAPERGPDSLSVPMTKEEVKEILDNALAEKPEGQSRNESPNTSGLFVSEGQNGTTFIQLGKSEKGYSLSVQEPESAQPSTHVFDSDGKYVGTNDKRTEALDAVRKLEDAQRSW